MRAVLCKKHGPPESLVLEEIAAAPLKPGTLRLGIHACGVNFPDTLIIEDKYQYKPPLPFSPGGEVAGEILEVADDVTGFAVGDRVIGMCGWGGFAEELIIEPERLAAVPDGMDFVTAAGFSTAYCTSYYALKQRAALQAGETLLVLGASGGVGLAALDIGKAMGARVIAAAGADEKLAVCRDYGADAIINYSTENLKDRAKELAGDRGIDVIYDPVGGNFAEAALRAIGWYGRYLVVGFAAGDIPRIPLNLALLKSCQIIGVFCGAFRQVDPETHEKNLVELSALVSNGTLRPKVSAELPLERAAEALVMLKQRKVTGKVVLTTGR
jgi:NADPH2:quinone reductase